MRDSGKWLPCSSRWQYQQSNIRHTATAVDSIRPWNTPISAIIQKFHLAFLWINILYKCIYFFNLSCHKAGAKWTCFLLVHLQDCSCGYRTGFFSSLQHGSTKRQSISTGAELTIIDQGRSLSDQTLAAADGSNVKRKYSSLNPVIRQECLLQSTSIHEPKGLLHRQCQKTIMTIRQSFWPVLNGLIAGIIITFYFVPVMIWICLHWGFCTSCASMETISV